MKTVVIGCGLAGVTTAYFLHRAGAEVTVVDRCPAPARETSYANGCLLTPSLADPWNAPGVLMDLVRSLGRSESAMLLHLRQVPRMAGWGLRFLLNARPGPFQESFLHNVRLASRSLEALAEICGDTGIEFEHVGGGILKIFERQEALDGAVRVAHWLKQAGITHQVLSVDQLLDFEPLLVDSGDRLVGAIHYPDDQVGNARLFCEALAGWLAGQGVEFRFSEQVLGFERAAGQVSALSTPSGRLAADRFVLAAGCFSRPLGRMLGLRLRVVPAKGYSITVGAPTVPILPLIDDSLHAAIVPLGSDRVRVAGTAEFAGFDTSVTPKRIANLVNLLERVLPGLAPEGGEVDGWAGLRPMTPDGRPLLGASAIGNLFLNTGHGALGWTLAAASGKVVAQRVLGEQPSYDEGPFRADRF